MSYLKSLTFFLFLGMALNGVSGEKIKLEGRDAPGSNKNSTAKQSYRNSDRELIRKILGGDRHFKEIEEEFEKLLEQFHQGPLDSFFKDDNFNKFFKKWRPHKTLDSNEFRWIETPIEKILIFKGKPTKNSPLSIKIENGLILISGKVVKRTKKKLPSGGYSSSYSSTSFSKSFSVPVDTDGTKAIIDNNPEGEIVIKLPKFNKTVPKIPKKQKSKTINRDRIPISNGSGQTI